MSESFRRIWTWPLVLAVFTTTGLVSALFSEGWGDFWSWIALSVPLVASGWCCVRPKHRAPASTTRDSGPPIDSGA
jgi:hypothetical protein